MVQKGNSILPQHNTSHHRHSSSPLSSSSSFVSLSSSLSTLVSPDDSPSLCSSARMHSTSTSNHKDLNDNDDNDHFHNHQQQPQSNNTSPCYSSRPWMSRQRSALTAPRMILVILILFMMLTILHLNTLHSPLIGGSNNVSTGNDNDNDIPPSDTMIIDTPTKNTNSNSNGSHDSNNSSSDNDNDNDEQDDKNNSSHLAVNIDMFTDPKIQSVTETALTRTIRYTDGRTVKSYKPRFWNEPEQAKKELGLFLDTLAKRSQARTEAVVLETLGSSSTMEGGTMLTNKNLRQERFFGFLPMGGGNNQFSNVQKAALLAKRTGRTLVLPPISPNTHIRAWDGRPYSEFYDIPGFIRDSGIEVVEWKEIKTVPSDGIDGYTLPKHFKSHWVDYAEDFPCQVVHNIGKNNNNLFDRFRNQYLLKFVASNVPEDVTQGETSDFAYAENVLLRNNHSSPSSSPHSQQQKQPKPSTPTATPPLTDLLAPLPRDELWQCLSSPYFLEMDEDTGPRLWTEVGKYLRFNARMDALTDLLLQHILLGKPLNHQQLLDPELGSKGNLPPLPSQPAALPEFIIVHLRRGDIVSKCHGLSEDKCLVQIEEIAVQVAKFQNQHKAAWEQQQKKKKEKEKYKPLPVLVTTNEKRKSELAKLERLGWIRIDHGDPEQDKTGHAEDRVKEDDEDETETTPTPTTIQLGTESLFGPYYPSILDGILLTKGRFMIGMINSRMSQLAATRGREWYGHTTVLMKGKGVAEYAAGLAAGADN